MSHLPTQSNGIQVSWPPQDIEDYLVPTTDLPLVRRDTSKVPIPYWIPFPLLLLHLACSRHACGPTSLVSTIACFCEAGQKDQKKGGK